MMKLYEVSTVTSAYHGCRDVKFIWFRCPRGDEPARPYSELIENYDPEKKQYYEEGAIDELFTFDEANALKEYLDREHGSQGVTEIKEAKLPCPQNAIGIGAMSVGGGDDFYTLNEEKAYSLPFKVWGYFNLRGCELVDEPGETFRGYLLIVGGPEAVHQETQKEAREREATHQSKEA
jgi:hypothetical protein